MKTKTHVRVLSLFLMLAMLIPMVSVPTFAADGETKTTEPTVYYSESFEGKTIGDVATSKSLSAKIVKATADADERGDVYQYSISPVSAYDYWIKGSGNPIALTTVTVNEDGTVTGSTAKGVTVTNATVNADGSISVKTTASDGAEYAVIRGAYKDAYWGTENTGADTIFKNTAINSTGTVTFAMKMYFSPDTKIGTSLDIRLHPSYTWLFSVVSSGDYVTIKTYDKSAGKELDALSTDRPACINIPTGQWFDVVCELDMTTTVRTLYVDGRYFGKYTADRNSSALSYGANTFRVGFARNGSTANLRGTMQIDDILIYEGSLQDHPDYKYTYYTNDFEVYEGVSNADFYNNYYEVYQHARMASTMVPYTEENGNTALKMDFVKTATVGSATKDNQNVQHVLSIPPLSYDKEKAVYFEAKYFIEKGSSGTIESQLYKNVQNGTNDDWINMYRINAATGEISTNGAGHYLTLGEWNTLGVVADLVSGYFTMYLNGKYVNKWKAYDNGPNIELCWNTTYPDSTGGWTVAKIQTNTVGDTVTGSFMVDDCRVTTLDDLPESYNFVAVPERVTYPETDFGTSTRLDLGPARSYSDYALVASGPNVKWDLTWDPANPTAGTLGGSAITLVEDSKLAGEYYTEIDSLKYYVVTAGEAELIYNGANIGMPLKALHESVSYSSSKYAVLEADYFIEEGSVGIIESQGEGFYTGTSKVSYTNLFTIDASSGRLDGSGMYLDIGAWNNVKAIIELATGEITLYANGVWAKAKSAPNANLTVAPNTWSVAKVQRQPHSFPNTVLYEGGLVIDNVSVYALESVPTSTLSDKFLSDADLNAYADALLEGMDGASIRLSNPTGLRFATRVDTKRLAHLETLFGEGCVVEMGTLIAPAAYLDPENATGNTNGVFTKEALDQLPYTAKYLDVKFDGVYFSGDAGMNTSDGEYMVGSVVNFKDGNISREYVGAGYVTISVGDFTYTVYSENCTRSAKQVAKAALADERIDWEALGYKELLTAYATYGD